MYSLQPVYPRLADALDALDLKNYLRVDFTADDALIKRQLRAAQAWAENFTSRTLVNTTFLYAADSFYPYLTDTRGSGWDGYTSRAWVYGFAFTLAELALLGLTPFGHAILVPRSPLMAVDFIKYVDQNGNPQTLDPSLYQVDQIGDIPRIYPAYGTSWPATQAVVNAVTVQFRAGWITPYAPAAVDGSSPTLKATRHPFRTGDNVRLSNSGGAPATGLAVDTDYVAANVVPGVSLELQPLGGGASIKPTGAATGSNFLGILPEGIEDALRLLVADLYDNREPGRPPTEIVQNAARNLLWNERRLEI